LVSEELERALKELDGMGRRGIFDTTFGKSRPEPEHIAAVTRHLADPLVWRPALSEQRRLDPQGEGAGWSRAEGFGSLGNLPDEQLRDILRWADLNSRSAFHCTSKALHFISKPPIRQHEMYSVTWTGAFGCAQRRPPTPLARSPSHARRAPSPQRRDADAVA
jgi:hypothetical protein